MSKKRVEKYIPDALEVLDGAFRNSVYEIDPNFPKDALPKEYNGYISAFGASLIQSGLKPTIAVYENQSSNTDKIKKLLTLAILEIMRKEDNQNYSITESFDMNDSLLRYILNSNEDEEIIKSRIKDIAVAIKLAIRTFKLEKVKGSEDDE